MSDPEYAAKIASLENEITNLKSSLADYRSMVDKYRTLAECSLAGIYVVQKGQFQYVNPRFVEMLGYDREEDLIGLDFWEIVHPEDRPLVRAQGLNPGNRSSYPARYAFRAIKKDRSLAWLDLRGVYTRYLGQPADIGTIVDVTEQKEAEEALRQSEEKYRTIIDHIEDGYYESDLKGFLTFFNDSFTRIWGCSRMELMGRNYKEYTDEKEADKIFRTFQAVLVTGRPKRAIAWKIKRKDGHWRHIELSVSIRKGRDEQPVGFRGIARDITDRKIVEEELKRHRDHLEEIVRGRTAEIIQANYRLRQEIAEREKAEARLLGEKDFSDSVIESLPGAFYVFDRHGAFLRWNGELEKVTGYSKEEIPSMSALDFFQEQDKNLVGQAVKEVFSQGRSSVEAGLSSKDGRKTPFYFTGVRARLDGKTYLVGMGLEITERKKAENALRESEKELRVLSTQLITAQEKERQRLALELHDGVGQALTAIKVGLEGNMKRFEHRLQPDGVTQLRGVVSMIQRAIEEVRRMSMDLRPSMLDDLGVLSTLTWFCREFKKVFPAIKLETKIEINETDVPEPLKIVIYRILQEALHNVAKHSQATKAEFHLQYTNQTLTLKIRDNGKGFDPDQALNLDSKNRGLGLASMRERTDLTGGQYKLKTAPNQGTSLTATWLLREK